MKISGKIKAILSVPVIYIIYCTAMYFGQSSISFPGTGLKSKNADYSQVTQIEIPISEGIGRAFYFDAVKDGDFDNPFVIFAHGNFEVAEGNFDLFDQYKDMNCDVLIIEYPGYGNSEGSPSEESINELCEKAYDSAMSMSKNKDRKVIAHGISIGGGVVCKLSRSRKFDAMILQCTFTSFKSFAYDYFIPQFLIRDQYDNEDALRGSNMPLLIHHGTRDILIPFRHAEILDSASNNSRLISYPRGHSRWFGYSEETTKFVLENIFGK